MKKTKKWLDAKANEWLCTLEWQEANNMSEEVIIKKVENGYILSGESWTAVYNNFKDLVKRLETIFGEGEKKKKSKKVKHD